MSGTPIEMSKVKQVIRMYESGVPKKEITRRLGRWETYPLQII